MVASTHQPALHPVTSNTLLCQPPAVFHDGDITWMEYSPRYHRSTPENFPRLELVGHDSNPCLNIEVIVSYDPDYGEHGKLVSTAVGLRLKPGCSKRTFRGSIVLTEKNERTAEVRAVLNQ